MRKTNFPSYYERFGISEIDGIDHIDWRLIQERGAGIAITGKTGQRKTTLLFYIVASLWGGVGYFRTRELVILRDHAKYETLSFTNYGYKVKLYIPRGGTFEVHDKDKVRMENISFFEFDPLNLRSIFNELSRKDAYDYIHVIQSDAYIGNDEGARSQWWMRFIDQMVLWKTEHKDHPDRVVFASDEFQQITRPRREGSLSADEKKASRRFTSHLIEDFRKFGIRPVLIINPFKDSDNFLRTQFPFLMYKNTESDDLPRFMRTWAKAISGLNVNEFLVKSTNQKGKNVSRFELDSPIHPIGTIHASVTKPLEFDMLGAPLSQSEKISWKALNHMAKLITNLQGKNLVDENGRITKLTLEEIGHLGGGLSRQGVKNYQSRYLTEGEKEDYGLLKKEVEEPTEPPPSETFVAEALPVLESTPEASPASTEMGKQIPLLINVKAKRQPAIPGEAPPEMEAFVET